MSVMVAQEVPTSTVMSMLHGPTGVAEARRRLRTDLYAQDVPEPVIDDAVLVLSELLSNSCRHARPLEYRGDGGDGTDRAGAQAPVERFGPEKHGSRGDRTDPVDRGNGRAGENGRGDELGDGRGDGSGDGPGDRPGDGDGCGEAYDAGHDAERDAGIRAAWSIGKDGLLLLEVTDGGGPTRPRLASPSLTAHGGRGLGIVGSLAHRWGVRDAPGEVTVWVLIPVRGRHARRGANPTGIGLPMGVPLDLPLDLAESLDDLG